LCITIAANIAETAILSFDACFPDSVVGFLAAGNVLSTRYVELYLRTIREQLQAYAPATAQKNINLETLNDVAIALPPLEEQEQIVAEIDRRLSVVVETEAQVEADLKRAERLRQGILKQAFAGKLVAQDPEDEPAGVLLERIRGQRRAGTDTGRPERALQLRLV
jgi:type I restriction enzyme S subunit